MRRPSVVNIMGHVVRILPMPDQQDDNLHGYCDCQKDIVYLRVDLGEAVWEHDLIHEVIHWIDRSSDLELDEGQISGIAAGLFSMGVRIR